MWAIIDHKYIYIYYIYFKIARASNSHTSVVARLKLCVTLNRHGRWLQATTVNLNGLVVFYGFPTLQLAQTHNTHWSHEVLYWFEGLFQKLKMSVFFTNHSN